MIDTITPRELAQQATIEKLEATNKELLWALEGVIDNLSPYAWGSADNKREALENARAAIARATGEKA